MNDARHSGESGAESPIGTASLPAPYWSSRDGRIVLHLGDCREVMATLADKSIDVVITDPPYSEHVHTKSRRGGGGKNGRSTIVSEKELGFAHLSADVMTACADAYDRLARRWVLVFSDVESSHLWRGELTASGLEYTRTGAWIKNGGTPQFTGDRPAVGFEAITICHPNGKKKWNGGGTPAVWNYTVALPHLEDRVHTTQKPIKLLRRLVELFTDPDELILDPFAGSGTTLVAAYEQGRRAIGVELDPKNAAACAARLESLTAQGALFGCA
jgi:DNA modification methylase